MMRYLLILFSLFIVFTGQAQHVSNLPGMNRIALFEQDDEEWEEEGRGFGISLNIGMYFASSKSANLYNGWYMSQFPLADNGSGMRFYTIEERLGLTSSIFNINTYNNAVNDLDATYPGITGFRGTNDMYPTNMRYSGAFTYGISLSYNFDWYRALVFNSNFMNVQSKGAFTLVIEGVSPQPNEPEAIELFTVYGDEGRFNLQLGFKQGWEINESARFFIELGPSMLAARIESNAILVGGKEYQLILGGTNPAQTFAYIPRTQVGFGAYVTPGFEFTFQDKITAHIGGMFARDKLKLESYEETVWNKMIYARFGF